MSPLIPKNGFSVNSRFFEELIKIKGKIRFFHLKIDFSLFFDTFTIIFATRNKQ